MPKVLQLISSGGFLGAENVVLELAKSARNMGDWHVIIGIFENLHNPHTEIAEAAKVTGIDYCVFPCSGRFDWKTISKIRAFILEEQPDIIHSHGYKSNFYALVSTKRKKIWITTNHLWKKTSRNLKLYAWLDSYIVRFADKIVAVSDEIAQELIGLGIKKDKIVTVDNGVDVKKFSACADVSLKLKKTFGIDEECKIIATIASLTDEKGHRYLIEAAKDVIAYQQNIRFLFIGDGFERGRIEAKIKESNLIGKVILAGARHDIPEILNLIDIFVLPSLKEGLPMALLEAMAAERPVIATEVGAIPKVIKNGRNGILVLPKDPNALSLAIISLLKDPKKMHLLAQNAKKCVIEGYSSECMAEKYFLIYRELLGKIS